MLPVLLDLKFIKIYTFGVFMVLALFWGFFLLWKNFLLTAHKEDEVFDGVFLALAGGLFLGRLVHAILNFKDFGFNLLKFILINGYPGISLYGFLAGSVLTLYLYFLSKKLNFRDVIDYFVPAFFLALGFGKVGSFFSGYEVGTKTKFPLALRYPGYEGFRHLTAFYEALLFFTATYLSLRILFAVRRGVFPKGFNFYFFWWYLGLVIFIFEPLKIGRSLIFGFKFNSLVSGVLLLTFSAYFLYYFRTPILNRLLEVTKFIKKNGQKTKQTRAKKVQAEVGERVGGGAQEHRGA